MAQRPKTDTRMARDVFLSYAFVDGQVARMLCEKLESMGISVWYSTRDIMPGYDFANVIPPIIRQCKVFLMILSEISMKSPHCLNELALAFQSYHKRGLSILPVLIGNAHLTDEVKYYLAMLQCINAPDPLTDSAFLDKVAERVQELLVCRENSVTLPITARTERRTP